MGVAQEVEFSVPDGNDGGSPGRSFFRGGRLESRCGADLARGYSRLGASLISQKEHTESNLSTLRSAMTDSHQMPIATDCLGH